MKKGFVKFNPDYLVAFLLFCLSGVNIYFSDYFMAVLWFLGSIGYAFSGYFRAQSQRSTERLQKTYQDGIEYHYEILRKYQELKDRQR